MIAQEGKELETQEKVQTFDNMWIDGAENSNRGEESKQTRMLRIKEETKNMKGKENDTSNTKG